jgi:hypothetical protein
VSAAALPDKQQAPAPCYTGIVISRPELFDVRAILQEAQTILNTSILPPRAIRAKELLSEAILKADQMLSRPTAAEILSRGRAKLSIKRQS